MEILEEYDSIIKENYTDHQGFINHRKADSDSKLLNSIIFCLKSDYSSYQDLMAEFVPDEHNKNEFFLYLEGRVKFLACTRSKEIFRKSSSPIKTEFQELCNKALKINPNAYFASMYLALYYESCKKYKDAIGLLVNIYNDGFTSRYTLWSIIYVSIKSHNWKTYRDYVEKVEPSGNRFLTKALYTLERYAFLRIFLVLFCLVVPFLSNWYVYVGILLSVNALLFYFVYYYKNRIVLSLYIYYTFIILIGLLFGLFCKLYGYCVKLVFIFLLKFKSILPLIIPIIIPSGQLS